MSKKVSVLYPPYEPYNIQPHNNLTLTHQPLRSQLTLENRWV